jgi:hypothetical protein
LTRPPPNLALQLARRKRAQLSFSVCARHGIGRARPKSSRHALGDYAASFTSSLISRRDPISPGPPTRAGRHYGWRAAGPRGARPAEAPGPPCQAPGRRSARAPDTPLPGDSPLAERSAVWAGTHTLARRSRPAAPGAGVRRGAPRGPAGGSPRRPSCRAPARPPRTAPGLAAALEPPPIPETPDEPSSLEVRPPLRPSIRWAHAGLWVPLAPELIGGGRKLVYLRRSPQVLGVRPEVGYPGVLRGRQARAKGERLLGS